MIVAVPRETMAGERRVALVPETAGRLAKAGLQVHVEAGAGIEATFSDDEYRAAGATIEPEAPTLLGRADVVLKVRAPQPDEVERLKECAVVVSFLAPAACAESIRRMAARRITSFSMDLMPRITRAQNMDALSSMGTISGYKAAVLAADHLGKLFPLLMTAAGTIAPARVFVMGAGVAGLQAIATAKRLGAVVEAYDVRPAVKEQVQSVGGRFVELPIEVKDAQDAGGYAKEQSEEFLRRQRELMAKHVQASDAVITTALVPGKRAPLLVPADVVRGMRRGSVIVDLAAEAGGNCELTEAGRTVVKEGVTVLGPVNLPSTMPVHASQMYSRNVMNYVLHLVKEGKIALNLEDELTKGPLVTHGGEVVHPAAKEAIR